MPTTALKHLAKKADISVAQAEHYWAVAKNVVKKEYDVDEHDGKFWALTTAIAKKMMGLKEAVSFRQFLEGAVYKEPEYEEKDIQATIDTIKEHCKDSHWMFQTGSTIWRGQSSIIPNNGLSKTSFIVDTSATERKSENTSNYYTMILDNNPYCKDFPKRGRSFIGTTSYTTAAAYSHRGNGLYAMIPFDGTKIGVVNEKDIWDIDIKLFSRTPDDITSGNMYFEDWLKLKPTLASFKEFDKELKELNLSACSRLRKTIEDVNAETLDPKLYEKFRKDFLNEIWHAYSPTQTGMVACTSSTFRKEAHERSHSTEVWVGGKVVMVWAAAFQTICDWGTFK